MGISLDDAYGPAPQGSGGKISYEDAAGAKPEGWDEYLTGLTGSVASGATFGFADEAKGAVRGVLAKLRGEDYGPAYERARDAAREDIKHFAERHPYQSLGGEVVGGATTALVGGAIPAVSRGLQLAGRMFPAAPAWLQWGARSAVPAATAGAVQGFGEGEGGLGDRAASAAKGAGFGAVAGPVLSGVVHGATNLVGRTARAVGVGDAGTLADDLILRNLQRDNLPLDEVRTRALNATEPTILPDLGGRNTQQLAGSAANMPGRPMEAADQVSQLRRAGAPDRLQGASDRALGGGSGGDVAEVTEELIANRRAAAAPLYDTAFQATVAENPDLRRMLAMPEIQQGIREGLSNQRIRAGASGQPPTYSGPELLDAGKRGLDDMLEQYRDRTTGRLVLDDRGRELENLRQSFVAASDVAVPELAAAREAWAGPSQSLDAVARGRRALTQDRDVTAAAADRLTPAQEPFYRLGAGRQAADMFSDPARATGNARRLLEDGQMQARLETLIPDATERQAFNRALQREVDMAAVNRVISPRAGSPTARNLSGADDIGSGGHVAAETMLGMARGGIGGGIARGLNAVYQRGQGLRPDVGEALASRLFTTEPAALQTAIDNLSRRAQARELSEAMQRRMAQRLMVTTGQSAARLGLGPS